MALYLKQDFSPPILSRKWIAMKFRPNMLLYSRHHIIAILESGLLFREDSVEVEQESAAGAEACAGAWLTGGERLAAGVALGGCLVLFRPKALNRSALFYLAAYATLPLTVRLSHRYLCRGALSALLSRMRDYLTLARRAAACLRECAALRNELDSASSVIESMRTMLCRQQSELCAHMSRASSAVLGNAPWLRGDLAWDCAPVAVGRDNLMKVHHAFLVVQSTLLKHIALAHFIPSAQARRIYKNHNERIHWIHHTLINNLIEEFTQNYETLERMYRLLKNYGNADQKDNKRLGAAVNDSWLYSDVHSDIARANLELKIAFNKCNDLDMLLDSCALNKQEIDPNILSKDIDSLIGNITKCLGTAQSSQIRLKKLLGKFKTNEIAEEEEVIENESENFLRIEDRDPVAKDEVFYFVKTEDDNDAMQPSGDVTTGPGEKEKAATRIALNELKRKLVNREDLMRERERQALVNTMPELKNNVPEFPRQMKMEDVVERKGYISKLSKQISNKSAKKKLFNKYTIQSKRRSQFNRKSKHKLISKSFQDETELTTQPSLVFKANSNVKIKGTNSEIREKFVTVSKNADSTYITKWHKKSLNLPVSDSSVEISDQEEPIKVVTLNSDEENPIRLVKLNACNEENGHVRNYKFTKKDLELSPSSTDSDSDIELQKYKKAFKRPIRKKKYPDQRGTSDKIEDEGLRPLEYSFGAGLAMASVLQINSRARVPNMATEDVFTADGELEEDSGNDDD